MDYPIQTPAQLSAHLRGLREAAGWSQAELGRVLGVNQPRIARIEADPGAVGVEQFMKLLAALGIQMVLRPKNQAPHAAEPGATYKASPGEGDW